MYQMWESGSLCLQVQVGKCLAARAGSDHSLAADPLVTVNANFRSSSLLFVPCKIGSKPMYGLFDTGAEVTLADVSMAGSAKWTPAPFINIPVTLDGTPLKIKGAVRAPFEFEGVSVPNHLIYLVEGLGVSCLLGTDIMSRFTDGFVLDFERKIVTLRSGKDPPDVYPHPSRNKLVGSTSSSDLHHPTSRKPPDRELVGRVRLVSPAVIPAGHEVLLKACVDPKTADSDGTFLVEPYRSLHQKEGLIGARALVNPTDAMIQVRMLNVSAKPVSLKTGLAIASVEVLPDSPVVSSVIEDDSDLDMMSGKPAAITQSELELLEEVVKGAEVSDSVRDELRRYLHRNKDVFSLNGELGCTGLIEHQIHTKDHPPIRQQPRRVPHHLLQEVDRQLDDMIQRGLIKESSSAWASPVVLVRKRNGEVRFCIDYRQLNQISHHDAYPVPRVDDALRSLNGAQWFSTLDLTSAYWQIPMDPESSRKAAFTTHRGLFEPQRMPFGLRSAPATMQRLMVSLFKAMNWKMVLVYLDDIVIFSDSVQQHFSRMDLVFSKLREANLKLKPAKCLLLRRSVEYLGHMVSGKGVSTSPRLVKAVQDYPIPQDVSGVRRFLGLTGYYRAFIHEYADIVEPLINLTRKNVRFLWDETCNAAFQKLKNLIVSAPVLQYPDFSLPFCLTTDASEVGISGILSQTVNGVSRPVGFFSSSLSRTQRNYSATDRECLAIVEAIRHFDIFLAGAEFTVCTDHRPLTYLQSLKEPRGRLARWLLFLNSYQFKIQYKPGSEIPHADALSRMESDAVRATILEPRWSTEVLQGAQKEDYTINRVIFLMRMGQLPSPNESDKGVIHLFKQRPRLFLTDQGILMVKNPKGEAQIVLPKQMVQEVLSLAHEAPSAGHLGVDKTLAKVRDRFYWPTMFNDVNRYCKTCHSCQGRKDPVKTLSAPLQNMPVPSRPFEFISVDHTGPLPLSLSGNRYILVISCLFTKWVECVPVRSMKADLTAEILLREVVCRYGIPTQIHSDQGGSFEADVIHNMCKGLGIDKTRTSPYHPESNGQTERFNSTVKDMLSHYVNQYNQRDWDKCLPLVLFAYRTSVHATTKFSPYELLFCRKANVPLDCILGDQLPSIVEEPVGKVLDLQCKIPEVVKIVRDYISRAQDVRNSRREVQGFKPYEVGDRVMMRNKNTKKGLSPKLRSDRWLGPYRVIKVISDVNYRVQLGRRKLVAHYNNLKPFHEAPELHIDPNPDRYDGTGLPSPEVNGQASHETKEGGSVEGDECQRFDADFPPVVVNEARDEGEEEDANQGEDEVVQRRAPSPLMRDGGRLWCNVDPRNEIPHGRTRSQAGASNT